MSDDGGLSAPRPVTIESPLGIAAARARLERATAPALAGSDDE